MTPRRGRASLVEDAYTLRVTHVGITGHQRIRGATPYDAAGAASEDWRWVRLQIDQILADRAAPLVGYSSLAAGADQIFAEVLLNRGGRLRVVRPFASYRDRIDGAADRHSYDQLLALAETVVDVVGPYRSDEDAYRLAGEEIVARSEIVLAVWDGEEPRHIGATGHIVGHARMHGCPVIVIDPVRRTVGAPG